MHSFMHRCNTLFTFFGSVAAVVCAVTSFTDLFHKSAPRADVRVMEMKKLVPLPGSKEQAVLTFSMDADLRSVFSWNTKQLFVFLQAEYATSDAPVNQVVLWDIIIQDKAKAHVRLKNHKTKYSFIHPSKSLRGTQVNLTLTWHVMPHVGFMYTQSQTFKGVRMPDKHML